MADAPRVFLSYSHDSDEHADRVLALADALCDRGIDVILDRYVLPAPAEGWPRWMDRNLDEAQFVLMVCTAIYHRRVMDREEPGQGLGVRWEGSLIYNRIYHDRSSGSRFVPVLLPGSEPAHIPNPVLGHSYYRIATFDLTDPDFEALYRHLTDQPATLRPDLGALTILPPRPRPRPAPGLQPPSGRPTTNVGGNPEGMSRDAAPTPTVGIITASSPIRVICPLHGIRTRAVWQKGLSDLAGSYGWVCRLDRWSYGRFSLLAFVTPWSREAKLGWLRRQYDAETHDRRLLIEKGQAPSVVAHSFGTYILGYTLLRFNFIRFNKVILCGSILPRNFPWDKLIARGQVQAVRNEFGVRDPWVKWVRWFVRGTGPSGASGFACTHERLEQEEFDFNHGDYFGIDHMEDRWISFLDKPLEEIPRSDVGGRIPRPHTSAPWGLYGLALLLCVLVTSLALFFHGYWHWIDQPSLASGDQDVTKARITSDGIIHIYCLENSSSDYTYSILTRKKNLTNEEDILPILQRLGMRDDQVGMQLVSPGWTGYDTMKRKNPDIILMHLSAFDVPEQPNASERLLDFLRVMAGRPDLKTQFIIYGRAIPKDRVALKALERELVNRASPKLQGRIHLVPIEVSDYPENPFLDPENIRRIQDTVRPYVQEILGGAA